MNQLAMDLLQIAFILIFIEKDGRVVYTITSSNLSQEPFPTFPKNLPLDEDYIPNLHYQCIIGATREAIFNAFSDDCFIIIKNHKTISANVPTSANVPSTRLSWLRQSNGRILVFIELEVQVFSIICLTTGFLILA